MLVLYLGSKYAGMGSPWNSRNDPPMRRRIDEDPCVTLAVVMTSAPPSVRQRP